MFGLGLFWTVACIVVGVVGLGYVYHRWTSQTTGVINTVANTVDNVIKDAKNLKK